MITLSELLDGAGYDIDHVKGALKRGFEDALGVEARRSVLTGAEIELAQRLNEKHRSIEWIYRMDDKRRRRVAGKWLKSISRHTIHKSITGGKYGKSIYTGLGHLSGVYR
jgi:hypothetical protein